MDELDSKQAADYLGVKTTTLYAYVSRGLIPSFRREDQPRRKYYRKADLDRLKRRSDAHGGHGAAAAGALDWGAPILDTAITQITPGGPVYRGLPARELARNRRFEQVAELLWGEDAPPHWDRWEVEFDRFEGEPLDRMRHALMQAELRDPLRFAATADARSVVARRIVQALSTAWTGRSDSPVGDSFVKREPNTALDAALIAIADHELNASTFAARVAASTGANLWACAAAGFATLTGPKHGASAQRCEVLVDEILQSSSPASHLIQQRLRRGEQVPGFGHPLYPDGDPRWRMIVSRLDSRANTQVIDAVDELVEVAALAGLGRPTVDLALATVSRAFDMEVGSSAAMFALGRSAGWVAHALEQYEQGNLLRPRAHFVG